MSKKLFLIGLNYYNTENQLQGCINDCENIEKKYRSLGFSEVTKCIESLDHSGNCEPTVANVVTSLLDWVESAKAGDFLAFHYSGHGTQVEDTNGDESDHKDEAIYLLDDIISDDDLNKILVQHLPDGVKLRCLFDCCHSGTILDLPYLWKKNTLIPKSVAFSRESNDLQKRDILMISGCRDDQTSADAFINKKSQGAMTWAWLDVLKESKKTNHSMTWSQTVDKMRAKLIDGGYDQVPQIATCDRNLLNAKVDFIL